MTKHLPTMDEAIASCVACQREIELLISGLGLAAPAFLGYPLKVEQFNARKVFQTSCGYTLSFTPSLEPLRLLAFRSD